MPNHSGLCVMLGRGKETLAWLEKRWNGGTERRWRVVVAVVAPSLSLQVIDPTAVQYENI